MTELEQQQLFVRLVAQLISYAVSEGYQLTFGEAWRTPEQAALDAKEGRGIVHSLHIERLAVDFNLFKDGAYLPNTEAHRPLGAYWKTLHPLARWGGDFHDGNHYSLEWQGRK